MLANLLRRFRREASRSTAARRRPRFRPQLEVLEERALMANNIYEGKTWEGNLPGFHVAAAEGAKITSAPATITWSDAATAANVKVTPRQPEATPVNSTKVDWRLPVKFLFDHWGTWYGHVQIKDQTGKVQADYDYPFHVQPGKVYPDAKTAKAHGPAGLTPRTFHGVRNEEKEFVVATGVYDRPELKRATDGDLWATIFWGDRTQSFVPVHVNRDGSFKVKESHTYEATRDYRVSVSLRTFDHSGNATRDDDPYIGAAGTDRSKAVITCPLNVNELRAIMPNAARLSDAKMQRYLNALERAWDEFGISTQAERAAFLAQAAVETDSFRTLKQYGSWKINDFNRGRGFLQLTGKANYQAAAKALGDSRIVNNPELVGEDTDLAARTAAWFWANRHNQITALGGRSLNDYADDLTVDSFLKITKAINGWVANPNGWAERQQFFKRALETMYLGVATDQRLMRIGTHNIADLNGLLVTLRGYGRGGHVEIWVSHKITYVGSDGKTHTTWSNPFAADADPHDHRRVALGYPCSSVDVNPAAAAH